MQPPRTSRSPRPQRLPRRAVAPSLFVAALWLARGSLGDAAPAVTPSRDAAGAPTPRDQTRAAEARKHFEEGKKRFALRQFQTALVSFSRAYELMPLPGFLFNIGQCHRFLGDCTKAIFFYSGFVRENPDTPDASIVQGLIARCQKDLARDEERRARASALFIEARKAQVLQRYDEATRLLTEAYQAFPLTGYLFHLGESHRHGGRLDRAIHFYEAYLKENPGGPQAGQVTRLIADCRRRLEEKRRKDLAAGRIKEGLELGRAGKDAEPRPRPLHKTWWLWTSVAVGIATAVGLGVGLGTRDNGPKDSPWATWNIR
ncbi:MAG: tetratricopeptide repeat protein [Polyangia bacterium]|jgi:tetratricopeptide (TPR) repeat protein|nr:tetratricopeptide repeat protein [Polyangia bacterium]